VSDRSTTGFFGALACALRDVLGRRPRNRGQAANRIVTASWSRLSTTIGCTRQVRVVER
jgi:hypothetical protein